MEQVFKHFYQDVFLAIIRVVKLPVVAEDIAQEVMYDFWKNHQKITITSSLRAYLIRAGTNKALNYVRDNRANWDNEEELVKEASTDPIASQKLEQSELERIIDEAIEMLPEKCRLVFVLSRYEEMTYQEIAEQLGISPKTVENQISKALRILREVLGPYLENGRL